MEKKVTITICTGTTCYILGGAELMLTEDRLPKEIRELTMVKGSTCLDLCKDAKNGKPPFVSVNGQIIPEATQTKIIDLAKNIIEAEQDNEPS